MNPLLPGGGNNPPPPPGGGGGNQQQAGYPNGMNPMMNPMMNQMMMQQMAAMQQMQQQQSNMNFANQNNGNQSQQPMMNPMMMNQMMMQQRMAMQQQQQQQQQKQAQQNAQKEAAIQKKLAQADPKAAMSPKAMELQKLQMEKMKQMMESQMVDLQKASSGTVLGAEYFQIESILTLFGVNQQNLEEIMPNFQKNNIKDSELINLDLNDDKLLKKLIPNTKDVNFDDIRRRFVTWIRYDIKRLHIHENSDAKEEKEKMEDSVVTLNISGTKYSTLKSTLLKTGSTYFQRLFSLDPNQDKNKCIMDQDNNYFIDRNGRLFEPILRYLQTKELFVKKNDWYTVDDVFEEMKYYDIQLPAQYDNRTDMRWLPDSFRFEYCCYYNQLQQFWASQFRILPKLNAPNIIKRIGALPKDCRDIDSFLSLKQKLTALGYELCDTQVFRGNNQQYTWTYIEFYKRIKWTQK